MGSDHEFLTRQGVARGADEAIARAGRGSGEPLAAPVRRKFEAALGADLGGVRVHAGGDSHEAARAVSARAFTVGQDIHFAGGQLAPHTPDGERLLAHEVAHTVQQGPVAGGPQFKLDVSDPGDAHELEADRAAEAMVRGEPVRVARSAAAGVHRDLDEDLMKSAAESEKQAAESESTQIVGSQSVLDDRGEARSLISRIDAAEPALLKMCGNDRDEVAFKAGPVTVQVMPGDRSGTKALSENVTTRFQLEQYSSSVEHAGSTLTQYQAAYLAAKSDAHRLDGMAAAYLKKKTGMTVYGVGLANVTALDFDWKVDIHDPGDASWTPSAPGEKAGSLSGAKDKALANPAFSKAYDLYNRERSQMATVLANVVTDEGEFQLAGTALQTVVFEQQGHLATAKAKMKEGELAGLMARINEAGQMISACVAAAGAVSGALALPPELGAEELAHGVEAMEKAGAEWVDPKETKANIKAGGGGNAQRVEKAKGYAGKAGKIATDLLHLDPEDMVHKILTMANAAQISTLQAEISAALTSAGLNEAAAAASHMSEKQQAFENAAKKLARAVKDFYAHRDKLKELGDSLVRSAGKPGAGGIDPDLPVALRFLTEADAAMPTIGLAEAMADRELQQADKAMEQRRDLSGEESARDIREGKVRNTLYWNDVVDGKRIRQNSVELKSYDQGSLAGAGDLPAQTGFDGGPNHGAMEMVRNTRKDLGDWKISIGSLQTAVSQAMGFGAQLSDRGDS